MDYKIGDIYRSDDDYSLFKITKISKTQKRISYKYIYIKGLQISKKSSYGGYASPKYIEKFYKKVSKIESAIYSNR